MALTYPLYLSSELRPYLLALSHNGVLPFENEPCISTPYLSPRAGLSFPASPASSHACARTAVLTARSRHAAYKVFLFTSLSFTLQIYIIYRINCHFYPYQYLFPLLTLIMNTLTTMPRHSRILGKSPDFIGKFPLSVTQNSPIFASEIRTTDV